MSDKLDLTMLDATIMAFVDEAVDLTRSIRPLVATLKDRVETFGAPTEIQDPEKDSEAPLLELQEVLAHIWNDGLIPSKQRWKRVYQRATWRRQNREKAIQYLRDIEHFEEICTAWVTTDVWNVDKQPEREYRAHARVTSVLGKTVAIRDNASGHSS
ncbi:hypothetical protein B0H19DRAFT_1069236 [Mycena capillaripes]|nr:hypothetical protein B0H19DRAFT_1069236 [Mycena capillaripes]